MASYLSPGVYVEEFDSGGVPMDGVSTSTAGFIGLAEKGPTEGLPQLVTSVADFRRVYGGYLSENEFGNYRYLAYAVEHFFINGGSLCYVMRVAPSDATKADNLLKEIPDKDFIAPPSIIPKEQLPDALKNLLKDIEQSKDDYAEKFNKILDEYKSTTPTIDDDLKKIMDTFKKDANNANALATYKGSEAYKNQLEQYNITKVPLQVKANSEGIWGNNLKIRIKKTALFKTNISVPDTKEPAKVTLDHTPSTPKEGPFVEGDIVLYGSGTAWLMFEVKSVVKETIELDRAPTVSKDSYLLRFANDSFDVLVTDEKDVNEIFEKCTLNPADINYIEKATLRSKVVQIGDKSMGANKQFSILSNASSLTVDNDGLNHICTFEFKLNKNGINGTKVTADLFSSGNNDMGPGKRKGLESFKENDNVSIIAIPGVTDPNVQDKLISYCNNSKSLFAILDFDEKTTDSNDLRKFTSQIDSEYAAIYSPWLQVFDPLEKRNIFIPPSGSMAGIYARSDQNRGVHKAPANEIVQGCTGLKVQYNKGEQDILNPLGINLIRSFTGQGIRVWGARTLSSNGLWKYINVRRLFIFIEESIKRNTNWIVFEPNDEKLWARVHRTIDTFLTRVWRDGALMGATPGEAFFVQIDRSTMTQDDIDNGRLICLIGVAPVKPAEFVIFRITQKTASEG